MAYDGTDEGALDRRLAARSAHLEMGDQLKADGRLLYAAALLDDDGRMTGSMEVVDFATPEDLDAYLEVEPYVTGDVWQRIDITPCRPGPSFVPATT